MNATAVNYLLPRRRGHPLTPCGEKQSPRSGAAAEGSRRGAVRLRDLRQAGGRSKGKHRAALPDQHSPVRAGETGRFCFCAGSRSPTSSRLSQGRRPGRGTSAGNRDRPADQDRRPAHQGDRPGFTPRSRHACPSRSRLPRGLTCPTPYETARCRPTGVTARAASAVLFSRPPA